MVDTLYVSTHCNACRIIENRVRASGLIIPIKNIDQDPIARAAFDRLGIKAVPAAFVTGSVHVGLDNIIQALRRTYGMP